MLHPPDPGRPETKGRDDFDDFSLTRLRWLIRLRWIAMAGVLGAAVLSAAGAFPGVAWPVLVAVALVGGAYNFFLWRIHREGSVATGRRPAMRQAIIDLVMLTVVLWAAGGIESPFLGYYVFHVALIGILGGPRATFVAAGSAFACTGLLWVADIVPALQIGAWDPHPPWDLLGDVAAFTTTVAAAAYIVTHAVRELRDREVALARARDRAALDYHLLSNTLDELEAGLEVVEQDGRVLWRNKRAEELAPSSRIGGRWTCPGATRLCERDTAGVCPVALARERAEPGRCRFAAQLGGGERVYEMMVFPLPTTQSESPRVMNLYVDRTQATLDERSLVLAERLASLGRVTQGVAHELNTPLATIRTLATDMRATIRGLADEAAGSGVGDAAQLADDLGESSELMIDETRRLGRITQALLAGGDLVRPRIDGAVPLSAVVERARALVFAGIRSGPTVRVTAAVGSLSVAADADHLVQILVNLLQNASDAVRMREDGGHVTMGGRQAGQQVEITVEDDGPGLDPDVAGRLFEPFATTKPPGEGTGLGLYTSYMLVQAMGGELSLEPRDGGGVRATVELPASTGERLAREPALPHRAAE